MLCKGIQENDVSRGCVIVRKNKCHIANEFIAELKILNLPNESPLLSPGFTCMMHLHTSIEEISIKKIKGVFEEQEEGNKMKGNFKLNKKIKFLQPG